MPRPQDYTNLNPGQDEPEPTRSILPIPDDSLVIIHSVPPTRAQSPQDSDTEELLRNGNDDGNDGDGVEESGMLGASSISRIVVDNDVSFCEVVRKALKKFIGIFFALISGLFRRQYLPSSGGACI